jgi:hypothetical protein
MKRFGLEVGEREGLARVAGSPLVCGRGMRVPAAAAVSGQLADAVLSEQVRAVHAESRHIPDGVRRVDAALHTCRIAIGRKRIERLTRRADSGRAAALTRQDHDAIAGARGRRR